MDRSAGGVIIVFAGVVLLIAAVKGSLKNVWNAVLTPDQSTSGTGSTDTGNTGGEVVPPSGTPTGNAPSQSYGPGGSFTGAGGSVANTGAGTVPGVGGGTGYLGLGGYGIPAGWPGSGVTTA